MTFQSQAEALARHYAECLSQHSLEDGHYADAVAAALWHMIDPIRYAIPIERAMAHLQRRAKPPKRYHTEFAAYALRHLPVSSAPLADAQKLRPKVANWLLLGEVPSWIVRLLFDRHGLIHDVWPRGFSAGYHGFSTGLLLERQASVPRLVETLRWLEGEDGFCYLLGRGAGQSFGAAASVWALAQAGDFVAAQRILHTLPPDPQVNCLIAKEPIAGAPETPDTPGWYRYNRQSDYAAFSALCLWKASQRRGPSPAFPRVPRQWRRADRICGYRGHRYRALMMGQGARLYDGAVQPVVLHDGQVILPPVAAEPLAPSLYGPENLPLPALSSPFELAHPTKHHAFADGLEQRYRLGGQNAQRLIHCAPDRIDITDYLPTPPRGRFYQAPRLILPDPLPPNMTIESAHPISPEPTRLYNIAGPARCWSCEIHHATDVTVTLTFNGGGG